MSRARILKDAKQAEPPGFATVTREDLHSLGTKRRVLSPKDVLLGQAEELKLRAVEEGRRDGFAAGYEEGLAEGLRLGEQRAFDERTSLYVQELSRFIQDLDEIAARVGGAMDRWYDAAEERIAEIVTQTARRLVQMELATNPEAIVGIIRSALQEIGASRKARIRINPFDLPAVTEFKESLIVGSAGLQSIEIVEDPKLLGGCIVESESGVIDASLETIQALMEDQAA